MRLLQRPIWLLAMMPASVGLAQQSICNPCVDPPAYQSPIRDLPPLPEAKDLRPEFHFGAKISNLRGLDTEFGARTLMLLDSRRMTPVGETESAAAEEEPGRESADSADEEADAVSAEPGPPDP
jgi:hypothetical protein